MLRATLLQLQDEQHFLLLAAHEIAWDGWSSGIAICELLALYDDAMAPGTVVPSNLPVQYADFVEQQREWLRNGQVQEQLGYWKDQLDGSRHAAVAGAAGGLRRPRTDQTERLWLTRRAR